MNYPASIKKSTKFYEDNKTYILNKFNSPSKLFSIELDAATLAKLFDQYSGIDYVLVNTKSQKIYGIAARVNFCNI